MIALLVTLNFWKAVAIVGMFLWLIALMPEAEGWSEDEQGIRYHNGYWWAGSAGPFFTREIALDWKRKNI